jgi:hypothetical protein
MKKIIFLMLALLGTTNLIAQDEKFVNIDWNVIKEEVKNNPEKMKQLIDRTAKLDTTLTDEDCMIAYCAQSFITNDSEEEAAYYMDKLYNSEKWKEAFSKANDVLKINPLNMGALYTAGNAYGRIYEDSINSSKDSLTYKDTMNNYYHRFGSILWAIKATGDGSKLHPYVVTKVHDEYLFMKVFLNLHKYKSQCLIEHFDMFDLNEKSEEYDKPQIYFEITRVLELEKQMLK